MGRHVIVKGDDEQAARLEIVRRIFQMHHEGAQNQDVMRYLRQRSIKSPKGSSAWSAKTLDYILHNEVYKGAGFIFKTVEKFDEEREITRGYSANYHIQNERDEWIELLPVVLYDPNTKTWEDAAPIVDPDVWQAVVDKRKKEMKEKSRYGLLQYYLSGFGRCPVCGGRWGGMHIKSAYGDYTYYRCTGIYDANT